MHVHTFFVIYESHNSRVSYPFYLHDREWVVGMVTTQASSSSLHFITWPRSDPHCFCTALLAPDLPSIQQVDICSVLKKQALTRPENKGVGDGATKYSESAVLGSSS